MGALPYILIGIVVLELFFAFRQQKKQQEERGNFQDSLVVGEEVVLDSGLYVTIEELTDQYNCLVRLGNEVVKVERRHIAYRPFVIEENKNEPEVIINNDDENK